jgi:hypothetical protein
VTVLALAAPAAAQTSSRPLTRVDAAGALGWFNARKSVPDAYRDDSDWYNSSLYGGASVGWYLTDHVKTELEAGASSEAELTGTSPALSGGFQLPIYSRYEFSTKRLAVGQVYQFYRNVWVHPFIGGGLDLTWETINQYDEQYSSAGPSRLQHPERSEFHVRPYATLGLKAYMTQRGFFRTDMKFVADSHGLGEVTLRFGLGIDF